MTRSNGRWIIKIPSTCILSGAEYYHFFLIIGRRPETGKDVKDLVDRWCTIFALQYLFSIDAYVVLPEGEVVREPDHYCIRTHTIHRQSINVLIDGNAPYEVCGAHIYYICELPVHLMPLREGDWCEMDDGD
jgi:hypothetical protein